jgi:hypothetical protein
MFTFLKFGYYECSFTKTNSYSQHLCHSLCRATMIEKLCLIKLDHLQFYGCCHELTFHSDFIFNCWRLIQFV